QRGVPLAAGCLGQLALEQDQDLQHEALGGLRRDAGSLHDEVDELLNRYSPDRECPLELTPLAPGRTGVVPPTSGRTSGGQAESPLLSFLGDWPRTGQNVHRFLACWRKPDPDSGWPSSPILRTDGSGLVAVSAGVALAPAKAGKGGATRPFPTL